MIIVTILILYSHTATSIPSTESFYDILNTTMDATEEEIKKKYRKLALIFHPDKYRFQNFTSNETLADSTAMFLKIQQAYEILSDPERRKQYDLSFEGIKYEIEEDGLFDSYSKYLLGDKKNNDSNISFSLPKSIGNGQYQYKVSMDQLKNWKIEGII